MIKKPGAMACAALLLFATVLPLRAADAKTNAPARVKVSGFGFPGNREILRLLQNFQVEGKQPTIIDQTFVEDAALVLLSRVEQDGYLNAELKAGFVMLDGSRQEFTWTNALEAQLPRDFAAREVRFQMRKRVRFHYDPLEITGAVAIPPAAARRYFVSGDTLLHPRGSRVFSTSRLQTSLAALSEALRRLGYREAQVIATAISFDRETGRTAVQVHVEEGRQIMVRSVTTEVFGPSETTPQAPSTVPIGEPYSLYWQQDLGHALRDKQYARGFPDAAVKFSIVADETNAARIEVDLLARVHTGLPVQIGDVRFEGLRRAKTSAIERRVDLEEHQPLNRVAAEKSRQQLARLGIFDWVGLRYEEVDETTRDVIYEFKESKAVSLSLLAGYGSYERLRGGLEYEHRNVFGLAHTLRLRALQSFKATSGELLYNVPEFLLPGLDVFVEGSGLRREEVSFTREEYGGGAGFHKRFAPLQTDLSVRYDYQFLNALDLGATETNNIGLTEARASAFIIDLSRDRRDNPLLPRSGLKLFSNLELAFAALGGNVDYQRLTLGGSYHHDLGGGRLLHLGLIHGITFTRGGADEELPFNKRFFPGGENSIRGFQQGEASPVDATGNQLGAETFTQANLEFEQLLTRSWSVVAFFDAVGFAQERGNYPWDEELYSVGGGLRWRTFIGPVRLEYGHNLNPRRGDPAGTLHLSIGFPF